MKYLTVMLITLSSGEQYALGYNNRSACGDALLRVDEVAAQIGVEIEMAACFETIAPATSIRPKRRPEAI